MSPEISEFSYGFALTNELVGWADLRTAPIFPNLVEEGRAGGGYDVKLDLPGVPMYLQFKRAECMKTRNAKEIQDGASLGTPFHRFQLMDRAMSQQHQLLLQLDDGTNQVYYTAPRFHTFAEINSAWSTNSITSRSIFIKPQDIGPLSPGSHTVAFDRTSAYLCSDPKSVAFLDADGLRKKLVLRLESEKLPLRKRLRAYVDQATHVANEIEEEAADSGAIQLRAELESSSLRRSRPLSSDEQLLRVLSDLAAQIFGSQLVVVQLAG
jgi:hypothetical protein